jgi:hypothetical protein
VNELEQERYEAELRRTPPARVPEPFMATLRAAKPCAKPARVEHLEPVAIPSGWWRAWRWLTPALAVGAAVAGLLVVRASFQPESGVKKVPLAAVYGLKAEDVQVDQELVSSFDVVARLPGGEPVRFHCQKWNDQVVVTDTNTEMEIEQNRPRIEVVPVRFETY